MLDNLLKISSISGAFLIFCGVLKLIIFYWFFGIDIVNFLTISEIITSFLDDINIIISYGLIMFLITLMGYSLASRQENSKILDVMEKHIVNMHPLKYKYNIFYIITIVALVVLVQFSVFNLNYFIIYIITFSCMQIISSLLIQDKIYEHITSQTQNSEIITDEDHEQKELSNFQFPMILTLVGTIIITTGLLAWHDIILIKNLDHNVNLIIDDQIIYKCGDKNEYNFIGKTENYIFIQNVQKNFVKVVKAENVKEYEFYQE